MFVLQVAALDGSTAEVTSKPAPKALEKRLQTELNDTEGWLSTKRRRRHSNPPANPVQLGPIHLLDSDDNTTEDASDWNPGPISHGVHDNERRKSSVVPRNEGLQVLQDLEAKRTETLSDRSPFKKARERDRHDMESSGLQKVVDSLKAEVSGLKASLDSKNLLESELRAGKAALQQNIQLLQNQVEESNQKTLVSNREAEKWKLESQKCLTQVNEKERAMSEVMQKLTRSEQNLEDLERSLETMKASHSKATHELDCYKREVQNLVIEAEKQALEMQQIQRSHEQEMAVLRQDSKKKMDTNEIVIKELEASKNSSRALQETVDRLAKHVERDNAKIDALEEETEKLTHANHALTAEQVRLLEATDGAVASLELVKGELRVAQSVNERSSGEISRLREKSEQAKDHIASLHSSLQKNEEELRSVHDENDKLRLLIKDIEDFESGQVRSIQNHVEKLRCAREFGPGS